MQSTKSHTGVYKEAAATKTPHSRQKKANNNLQCSLLYSSSHSSQTAELFRKWPLLWKELMNKVKWLLIPQDSTETVIDPSLWVTPVPPVWINTVTDEDRKPQNQRHKYDLPQTASDTWITYSLPLFLCHCRTVLLCWQVAEVELEWNFVQLV